ncbi:MAG: XrtN system VIT domain-containing protein [Bacteroidetes bacterium]|nr:MAG: XrtN system VIT domain-containing protein [Bacteroidota bacterium]
MIFSSAPLRDKTFTTGLALFAAAVLVFAGTDLLGDLSSELFTGSFFLVYGLFWAYLIIILISNKRTFGKRRLFGSSRQNILLLQLANLSAYTLNRTIPVFQDSTDWLIGYLAFYHLALLAYCFRADDEPDGLNLAILLAVSTGTVFHLYETVFLAELYPITLASCWFFGISLLALVPLWHLLQAIHIIRRYLRAASDYRTLLVAGIAIPLLMATVFTVRWYRINQAIVAGATELERPLSEQTLPPWVLAASALQDDPVTQRILKGGLVYQLSAQFRFLSGSGLANVPAFLNERRQHDPFIVLASAISGQLDVPDDTRLKLLNTLYGNRHQTERKLWSGDNLVTDHVRTQVQLFPAYRLSYTEKTIRVRNTAPPTTWRGQQEALYTFYLPEGAVVSSASLWIDGQEAPAYLTTRAKADSAYRTIVGVESRDPLLVHWQEGNRVTARIFPVLPGESRQFKIGITAPLTWQGQALGYANIDFQGPFWQLAQEDVEVVTTEDLPDLSAPWSFTVEGNSWRHQGAYQSDWELRFATPPLATDVFTFHDRGIQLQAYGATPTDLATGAIYLDINRGWNADQLKELWPLIRHRKVYVFTNRLETVTAANHEQLFQALLKKRFSLFPFYQIADPANALVLTNYSGLTPTLDDLKGSEFANRLSSFLRGRNSSIQLFNLNRELSPYLRTLRDLRLFNYAQGNLAILATWLGEQKFYGVQEDNSSVVNHLAHLRLREVAPSSAASQAPDHLLRVYAYNDLLKKIGKDYFNKDAIAPALLHQAAEAHVLTPVSSMIVLERQADYDRFDIQASKGGLGNATLKSSGSIPEPHEWALLLLGLLFMGWAFRRSHTTAGR